jgi:hypothetical protein
VISLTQTLEQLVLSPYPIPLPPIPEKINNTYTWYELKNYKSIYNTNIDKYEPINFHFKDLSDNMFFTKKIILNKITPYGLLHYRIIENNVIDKSIIELLIIEYANKLVINMDDISILKNQLVFIARLSVNYHSRAERFYLNIANIATYLAIILSAGTMAVLSDIVLTPDNIKTIGATFSLVVLIINGGILAYGIPQKANTHANFRMQWIKQLGNIQRIETNSDNYSLLKNLEYEGFLINEQEPVTVKKWVLSADRLTRINMGLPQHKT